MRKSNIEKIRKEFKLLNTNKNFVPRGLVFQIPPSNVNSIFIYSWVLSLLAGNKNIVRISNKKSDQLKIITNILKDIFDNRDWVEINNRNNFFFYDYDDQINQYLSLKCDARVVWGGDNTVQKMRTFKLNAHATEINFPIKFPYP